MKTSTKIKGTPELQRELFDQLQLLAALSVGLHSLLMLQYSNEGHQETSVLLLLDETLHKVEELCSEGVVFFKTEDIPF